MVHLIYFLLHELLYLDYLRGVLESLSVRPCIGLVEREVLIYVREQGLLGMFLSSL